MLSHLDLGRDAANLFVSCRPDKAWVEATKVAVVADPRLQFTPLFSSDIGELRGTALRPALEAEETDVAAAWAADPYRERWLRFGQEVVGDLAQARKALGAGELVLFDIPALGPNARAVTRPDGLRVVATSLAQDAGHVFCQILHEEMHPHTDPIVLHALGGAFKQRDTRYGSEGWALHHALEVAAVEGGRQIVQRVTPHRADDYARWCQRFE